jgi:HlyD family secretion protein
MFHLVLKMLTGDSTERVDTRVLQIIYELERPAVPVYVGQQVDVFIKRDEPTAPVVSAVSATNHVN